MNWCQSACARVKSWLTTATFQRKPDHGCGDCGDNVPRLAELKKRPCCSWLAEAVEYVMASRTDRSGGGSTVCGGSPTYAF